MIGDVVRLIADWLEDGTYGVGALVGNVPRDGGDPLPTTPAVQDETRDSRIGRGRLPESAQPILAVTVDQVTALDQSVTTDAGYFAFAVRVQYWAADVDADQAKRDGNYVLRAAVWSIRWLHERNGRGSGPTRNQIALQEIGPIVFDPWDEQLEQSTVVGGFTVQFKARDFYPL